MNYRIFKNIAKFIKLLNNKPSLVFPFLLIFAGCSVQTTRILEKVELFDYEQNSVPNLKEQNKLGVSIGGGASWYNNSTFTGSTHDETHNSSQEPFMDSTVNYQGVPDNYQIIMREYSLDVNVNIYLRLVSLHLWGMGDKVPALENSGIAGSLFYNWKHVGSSLNWYWSNNLTTMNMSYLERIDYINGREPEQNNDFKPVKIEGDEVTVYQEGFIIAFWLNSFSSLAVYPYFYFETSDVSIEKNNNNLGFLDNHRYSKALGIKYKPVDNLSLLFNIKQREIVMQGGGANTNYFYNFRVEIDLDKSMLFDIDSKLSEK